jgi:hypothetical protein
VDETTTRKIATKEATKDKDESTLDEPVFCICNYADH